MAVNNRLKKAGRKMPVEELPITELKKFHKALEILKTECPSLQLQYQFSFCESMENRFRAICEKLQS